MASTSKGAPQPSERKPKRVKKGTPEHAAKVKAFHDARKDVRAEKPKLPRRTKLAQGKTSTGLATLPPSPRGGNPAIAYTEELKEALLGHILNGVGIAMIGRSEGMPSQPTLLKWLADKDHPFSADYQHAKAMLVPLYEEKVQATAEEALIGKIVVRRIGIDAGGNDVDMTETRTVDNVERSKLMVQAYQWTLGHLAPKKHGRQAAPDVDKPNEQLEGLFAALKSGPVVPS